MTLAEFRHSLTGQAPPDGLDPALQALWWAGRHDRDRRAWGQAHACVQQREGEPACDWVHAYLHRQEGDLANAGYWYRRAGRPVAAGPAEQEWTAIARWCLQRPGKELQTDR